MGERKRKPHGRSGLDGLKNSWRLGSRAKNRLKATFSLARALPKFLRERVTAEEAQEEIKRDLDRREESFLNLARTRIYENPGSPYLKLLKIAGCEFADLREAVHRRGLEGALERLAGEGVHLTADEFKGKKEILRGGAVVPSFTLGFRSAGCIAGVPHTEQRDK